MIFLDQYARQLGVGDLVVPKQIEIQEFVIADIKESAIAANKNQPPMATMTLRCEITVAVPNAGQPAQSIPLLLVRKAEKKLES